MKLAQKLFIRKIGKAAVKYYKKYKILPSLTIAQAILESSWGRSGLSKDCNNFFGMKWVPGCGCAYKAYKTKEQKKSGAYYTIIAKFRKFGSVAHGVKGYFDFISYDRYKNLKGCTSATEACNRIRQDGWATSLSYSQNLIKLINTYGLRKWDNKAIQKVNGFSSKADIQKLQIKLNTVSVAHPKLTITGKYDESTRAYLVLVWKHWGWNKDGKASGHTAGAKTLKKLDVDL